MSGVNKATLRTWVYPILVVSILVSWASYMQISDNWKLFQEYWGLSLTMGFGSIIAGATPQGGAAVAFPVFTKVFHIPSPDARTFGLMIQAVGMTVASITIIARGVPILWKPLLWTCLGSTVGIVLGTYFLPIPAPYPKILFTLILSVFGVALVLSRWLLPKARRTTLRVESWRRKAVFITVGVLGGVFAAYTGSGVDSLFFIFLALAFGVEEKVGTPTTVIAMAFTSVIGALLHSVVSQDVGVALDYWLVALPVVIFGAPLGAWFLSRISRDALITGIVILILIELISTLILITLTPEMIMVCSIIMILSAISFYAMIRFQYTRLHLK